MVKSKCMGNDVNVGRINSDFGKLRIKALLRVSTQSCARALLVHLHVGM